MICDFLKLFFMKLSYLFTDGEGLDKSNLEFNLQDFWLRLRTYSKTR